MGLSETDALLNFNLASLQTRRDLALLGLVHRTVLGKGPSLFTKWFFSSTRLRHSHGTRLQQHRHTKQLHDWVDGDHTELLRRSPLGLPRVYNLLPQRAVDTATVSCFQRELQILVGEAANSEQADWALRLSPRRALWTRR